MTDLRIGMLGTIDHIGLVAGEAAEREDIEFVGIAEPDGERGRGLAEKYHTRHFETKEALLDQKLDAVGVFTPFYEKADDIAACLDRGLHVFADKPAATNPSGLERIQSAVRQRPELKFTMGLTLRVQSQYVKVREIVQSGAVGVPAVVYARRAYRLRRASRPDFMFDSSRSGGIWVELAVHDIDYVRWLLNDEVLSVSALHGNASCPTEPFQDHAAGIFHFRGGAKALIDQNRLVPEIGGSGDNRLSLVGSKGTVDFGPDGVWLWNNEKERHKVEDLPPRASMFANFVDAIRDNAALIAPAEDVLRATEAALAAYASAEQNGAPKVLAAAESKD